MRAIRISEWGGPDVLELVAGAPVPEPGDGEVLVRVSRAGVNFADTHARENVYLARYELPLIPGSEVAGTLEDGTRVVALCKVGGYAEYAVAPREMVVPVPDGVSDGAALALLLQGLTGWHLLRTAGRLAEGDSVVVVGAAGGTGSLLVQLCRAFGAGRIIGLASSEDKRALALELGCDVALDGRREDLLDALVEANGGRGVDLVLEAAGGATFEACLRALADLGRLVVYGISSREQNHVRTGRILRRSQSVIGFWLWHFLDDPGHVGPPLAELFDLLARGQLRVVEGTTYPLSEARKAHEDLVGRRTTGKLLLDPGA